MIKNVANSKYIFFFILHIFNNSKELHLKIDKVDVPTRTNLRNFVAHLLYTNCSIVGWLQEGTKTLNILLETNTIFIIFDSIYCAGCRRESTPSGILATTSGRVSLDEFFKKSSPPKICQTGTVRNLSSLDRTKNNLTCIVKTKQAYVHSPII